MAQKKPKQFQWTDAMSVGVPALDNDHRCLVRVTNLLQGIKDDEDARHVVITVLDTLKLYGRNHFRREERVMEAIRFPGAAFHHAEHQGFADYIDGLRARCGSQPDSQLATDLYDYLTGWLRHHILIQDMAYKPYVRAVTGLDDVASEAAPGLPSLEHLTGRS